MDALFELFDETVMDVELLDVVQFIIDNVVEKLLMNKYLSIIFSPCVTHYLDLALENISKLEWVKKVMQMTHAITKFIYNHIKVLCMMCSFIEGKKLVQPRVTRFTMYFLGLRNLYQQKMNLN